MREHTVTLYKFDELSQEAQQKAIQSWRESKDFSVEAEHISEMFKEYLQELGYPTDDVCWSLTYSQGDGVAFYGEIPDIDKVVGRLVTNDSIELYNRMVSAGISIWAEIYRNDYGYRYSHRNTMEVELHSDYIETIVESLYEDLDTDTDANEYTDKYNEVAYFLETLQDEILSDIKSVSDELEKKGYKSIEYYTSDETISETLVANDYEFYHDGTMAY